jgi:hypothetical protein
VTGRLTMSAIISRRPRPARYEVRGLRVVAVTDYGVHEMARARSRRGLALLVSDLRSSGYDVQAVAS